MEQQIDMLNNVHYFTAINGDQAVRHVQNNMREFMEY